MSSPISILAIIYFPLLISCVSGLKDVDNVQQFIATEKIEAEFYTTATSAAMYDDCAPDSSIIYMGEFSSATVLEYDQVDFSDGVQRVSLRVANVDPSVDVYIAFHLSNTTGPTILSVPIFPTGSDQCAFVTLDVGLQEIPSGKQNLYITFPSGNGGQLYLDWFQFNRTGGGIKPATELIQAEDYDYASDMEVDRDCSDYTIVGTDFESMAEYYQVDFGVGVQRVTVRGHDESTGTESVAFRIGSSSNAAIATAIIPPYQGSCVFAEVTVDLTETPTGLQNLFVSFEDDGYDTYLDSFVFVRVEPAFNATERIEAEDYTSAKNVSLFEDCGDPRITYVGQLQNNSVLEYDGVDFGSGVDTVTLRVYCVHTGPPLNVTLHLGTATNTPLVTIPVGQTGTGKCDFYTITTFLTGQPSGVQNLFFTFPDKEGGYLNLDWFVFDQTTD